MLGVESQSGQTLLDTIDKTNAEVVAAYLIACVFILISQGKNDITIFLDNAKTHKVKMKSFFYEYLQLFGLEQQVQVKFIHTPAYSPYMNVAEYFIRIIRQKYLNHLPAGQDIEQVVNRLIEQVHLRELLSPQQINNIIRRATNLAHQKRPVF